MTYLSFMVQCRTNGGTVFTNIMTIIKTMPWKKIDGVDNRFYHETATELWQLTIHEAGVHVSGRFNGAEALSLDLNGDVINLIPMVIYITKHT